MKNNFEQGGIVPFTAATFLYRLYSLEGEESPRRRGIWPVRYWKKVLYACIRLGFVPWSMIFYLSCFLKTILDVGTEDDGLKSAHVNLNLNKSVPLPIQKACGVLVDTDLKFHGHVQKIAHKAGGLAHSFLRSTVCCSQQFMMFLLTMHIRSLVEYCSCVWHWAHWVCPGIAVTQANPASLDQADWWYGPPPLWRASKAPEPLLYPRPTAAGWPHTVLEDFSWPLVHLACWSILPVYPNLNPWSQVQSISPCRQYRCAQEVILNQVHTYLELSV